MRVSMIIQRGALVFVLALVVFLAVVKATKPRILVLHSYAQDFSWVTDMNTGIERVLGRKSYSIRYHYMDTKRHPDPAFKIKAGIAARKMIDTWRPQVIIAVDDNAQEYAARHYVNRPDVSIVFCGVNGTPGDYGYSQATNVTGMLERLPIATIREQLQVVFYPGRTRIFHMADASETSQFISRELDSYNWAPFVLTSTVLCETFDDWKRGVSNASACADILLITHYHTIQRSADDHSTVPPQEIIRWTMANTRLPSVGCWGFFVQDGGPLAFGVSPFEQGEEAAAAAAALAEGRKQAREIPISTSRQLVISARESQLKALHIQLPALHEAFARATGNYFP